MLNANTLSQLSELKTKLREENPHYTGTVRGSNGKHGFVQLDQEKRSIYLGPDQMQQVLPGDQVEITLKKDDKDREQGQLEALLNSEFKRFTGEVIKKGNNTFINVDAPDFKRWLFVAPSQAKKLKAGDYVVAELHKHPFGHGRPQINIKQRIGHKDDAFIEHTYALAVHDFKPECSNELKALVADCDKHLSEQIASRQDMSDYGFITIDGENSLDLDDALTLESNDDGFVLRVAIADPTSFIALQKHTENEIRKRANSLYFPGKTYHMLPQKIAEQTCSLLPEQQRLVLLISIKLDSNYSLESCDIEKAVISTKARLSYQAAQDLLDANAEDDDTSQLLHALAKLQQGLLQQRQQNALVNENKPDYHFELDDKGKLLNITQQPRLQSQQIVEECMLLTNLCVAHWLQEKKAQAAFTHHSGFKSIRLDQIDRILKTVAEDYQRPDTTTLQGFVEFMQFALSYSQAENKALPLDKVLKKQLERAQISSSPKPHLALGFDAYAPFTSPLRRYQDFINHRAVHAVLDGKSFSSQQSQLDTLQESVRQGRFAVRLAEATLACQFIAKQQKEEKGKSYPATIHHINSRAINVTLDDYGIDAMIETRHFPEKFKFDSTILRLTHQQQKFDLGQSVTVCVEKIDFINRQIHCKLIDEAGT